MRYMLIEALWSEDSLYFPARNPYTAELQTGARVPDYLK